MSPKRLYNFRIDPDLDEGLKAVKERDGIAESEQIRRAIRAWLEEKGVIKAASRRVSPRRRA
jgi:predicted DNA-binding protein